MYREVALAAAYLVGGLFTLAALLLVLDAILGKLAQRGRPRR